MVCGLKLMEDRFIVKNNSGNVLMLSKNRITLAVGGVIDLAKRLNKTIGELNRDQEISLELSNGNLIKEDEFDSSKEAGLDRKLDALIDLMKEGKSVSSVKDPSPQTSVPFDISVLGNIIRHEISKISLGMKNGEDPMSSEEEKMRERALMEMIKNKEKGQDSNLDGFGGQDKETDSDDFTDLIDF